MQSDVTTNEMSRHLDRPTNDERGQRSLQIALLCIVIACFLAIAFVTFTFGSGKICGKMATPSDKTVSRVALCSAIFAGFAYVSYSVVRNAVCRRGRGRTNEDDDLDDSARRPFRTIRRLSVASQTDLLLGNLDCANGGVLRPLSVQERIRELNLRARQFGEEGIIVRHSPFFRPRSLQSSPWSSPRILSPVDVHHFVSRSAENLSITSHSPPSSPNSMPRRKSNSTTRRSLNRQRLHECEDAGSSHQITEVHILLKDSEETLRKRLDGLYDSGRVLTPHEAQSLVALMYTRDESLLLRTLTTITNCAAFSANQVQFAENIMQDYLREAGCLAVLDALVGGRNCSQQAQMAAIQAVGNLSLNKDNMRELKGCIRSLIDRMESSAMDTEDTVLLPVLTTLTNLAVLPEWHGRYTRALHVLFRLLERGTDTVRLQACKLLVNLSCNPSIVPHLLAAQAPSVLLQLLDQVVVDEEFLLRFTTVLDNITAAVQKHRIGVTDLPTEEKAPSPETLYTALYGFGNCDRLRAKLLHLEQHCNEEIQGHAKRSYSRLSGY